MLETVAAPDSRIIDDAHQALVKAGVNGEMATDAINQLQNAGLLLRRREADFESRLCIIDFDAREPVGPMLVGPFESVAEAESWHRRQNLESSCYSICPVSLPEES